MVRHVLVPLDGSVLAETALSAAASTATAFDARITLFHVLEAWAPQTVHGQQHLTDAEQAKAYLESVAQRPVFRDRAVDIHDHAARTEDVADSMMAHADELAADLWCSPRTDKAGSKGSSSGALPSVRWGADGRRS